MSRTEKTQQEVIRRLGSDLAAWKEIARNLELRASPTSTLPRSTLDTLTECGLAPPGATLTVQDLGVMAKALAVNRAASEARASTLERRLERAVQRSKTLAALVNDFAGALLDDEGRA